MSRQSFKEFEQETPLGFLIYTNMSVEYINIIKKNNSLAETEDNPNKTAETS